MKRTFLLLELLIAFSLISLFAFPLIFNPLSRLNQELAKLEEIEAERLSEVLLAEVKEKLYLNKIPWEKIPRSRTSPPFQEFNHKEYPIYLSDFKKHRTIPFDIYLYWDQTPKKDKEGREFGLLTCELVTPKKHYLHKLFLFSYQGGNP